MSNIQIFSDSSCDLKPDIAKAHDIIIVPFQVTLDGTNYYREFIDITLDEFYHRLRTENVFPKTSLPSIPSYMDAFKVALDEGKDVLCFNLTSKFSGSHQSALNAKNMLEDEYPERKIVVLDSEQVTMGQGMLVLEAAKMRDAGLPLEEIVEKAKIICRDSKIYVTTDTLAYLQKGGRIGRVSSIAGSLLNIKPIIVFDEGELIPLSKVRGQKKAVAEVIGNVMKDIGNKRDLYNVFFLHSDLEEGGKKIYDSLESEFGIRADGFYQLGTTIGAHIGPDIYALGYTRKYETL